MFGMKNRDNQRPGLEVLGENDVVQAKTILIIDDICSRRNVLHSAKALKNMGAAIIDL